MHICNPVRFLGILFRGRLIQRFSNFGKARMYIPRKHETGICFLHILFRAINSNTESPGLLVIVIDFQYSWRNSSAFSNCFLTFPWESKHKHIPPILDLLTRTTRPSPLIHSHYVRREPLQIVFRGGRGGHHHPNTTQAKKIIAELGDHHPTLLGGDHPPPLQSRKWKKYPGNPEKSIN